MILAGLVFGGLSFVHKGSLTEEDGTFPVSAARFCARLIGDLGETRVRETGR